MTPVAALRHDEAPERGAEWRQRSARLYEELRRPARAMIRRAFRGAFADDEIEDVYSAAWLGTLRALERRHAELSDEEIRKYLLTAVANHASKELRRRKRRPTAPLEAVHTVADDGVPPDESVAKLEESRVARDLLASLPPRRRAVMLLRYGWGLEPGQVCGLVKGLSPRAYRKEITRGVDEMTEKLRLLERGEWCADREPVLKAYAAGIANADQQRQAQQHLSHCRHCSAFVGKLSGHLHDLGASIAVPSAIDGMDGHVTLVDRLGALTHRIRDAAGHPSGHSGSASEATAQVATTSGVTRGAGAAGTGVLAKLAGLGSAGKLAALCLGGGVAATACVAAGVVPVNLAGIDTRSSGPAHEQSAASEPPVDQPSTSPQSQLQRPGTPSGAENDLPDAPAGTQPDPAPIAPSAPPPQQEFGVASAAPVSTGSTSSGSSGGGAPPVQREFGP